MSAPRTRCGAHTSSNGWEYTCSRTSGHAGHHKDGRRGRDGEWLGVTWSNDGLDGARALGLRDGWWDLDAPAGMTQDGEHVWRHARARGHVLRVVADLFLSGGAK